MGALEVANVKVNIRQMFDPGWGDRRKDVELAPIKKLGHV